MAAEACGQASPRPRCDVQSTILSILSSLLPPLITLSILSPLSFSRLLSLLSLLSLLCLLSLNSLLSVFSPLGSFWCPSSVRRPGDTTQRTAPAPTRRLYTDKTQTLVLTVLQGAVYCTSEDDQTVLSETFRKVGPTT
jgi:hypothetical protein